MPPVGRRSKAEEPEEPRASLPPVGSAAPEAAEEPPLPTGSGCTGASIWEAGDLASPAVPDNLSSPPAGISVAGERLPTPAGSPATVPGAGAAGGAPPTAGGGRGGGALP